MLVTSEQRAMLLTLGFAVTVHADQPLATITQAGLASLLKAPRPADREDRLELPLPATIVRRGHQLRLAIAAQTTAPARDGKLLALLPKAESARRMLLVDRAGAPAPSNFDYSEKHLARLARLSFLAPDIVSAMLDGTPPPNLTARQLLRIAELPLDWREQRRVRGFIRTA